MNISHRRDLPRAERVVVKIGSSSLTRPDGSLDVLQVRRLVDVLGQRIMDGGQVVLVSSGSIAAGIKPLGLTARPKDLALAQAAASVGQGLLMARYSQEFSTYGVTVGQVLLTIDDMVRRQHYINGRRALHRLLASNVLPIVNENDTVATHEIRFGDNDRVAALVAQMVRADALVLLTDVDGLYDGPPSRAGTRLIRNVTSLDDLAGVTVTGRGSAAGTGGMVTKLDAAQAAVGSGIPVVLTSAPNAGKALAGEDVGTWFAASGTRRAARTLWLAHAARVTGAVTIDDGAVRAVRDDGRSLLAAGIAGVSGDFQIGDVIEVRDVRGTVIARGRAAYDSQEVAAMAGRRSADLRDAQGRAPQPVIHRDDLATVRTFASGGEG